MLIRFTTAHPPASPVIGKALIDIDGRRLVMEGSLIRIERLLAIEDGVTRWVAICEQMGYNKGMIKRTQRARKVFPYGK